MKTLFFTLLVLLSTCGATAQEEEPISLNQELQLVHADTIKTIRKNMSGIWKYLGKKSNNIVKDTIEYSQTTDELVLVENGNVFEIKNGKKSKAAYYIKVEYNLIGSNMLYNCSKANFDNFELTVDSCQPVAEIVFYQGKFGVLYTGMFYEEFVPIQTLTKSTLLFENGKKYHRVQ